jgi:hypothetical protein
MKHIFKIYQGAAFLSTHERNVLSLTKLLNSPGSQPILYTLKFGHEHFYGIFQSDFLEEALRVLAAFTDTVAKPNDHKFCQGINVSHHIHLLASFLQIGLVNTENVDPVILLDVRHDPYVVKSIILEPHQCGVQIGTTAQRPVILSACTCAKSTDQVTFCLESIFVFPITAKKLRESSCSTLKCNLISPLTHFSLVCFKHILNTSCLRPRQYLGQTKPILHSHIPTLSLKRRHRMHGSSQ